MWEELFRLLGKVVVPYYLQGFLESKYNPSNDDLRREVDERVTEYKDKIQHFSNLDFIQKRNHTINLANPRTSNDDFSEVASEASLYLQQGLEMLRISQKMEENSSPLVEYYGLLQCVKGAIILELSINQDLFFRHHGLTPRKGNSRYINAKIKPFGVFSALLLRIGSVNDLDHYLSGNFYPSMEEVLALYDCNLIGYPLQTFIGSWMLSTLVRYQPHTWQEILRGKNDDIIVKIRDFRRDCVPGAIVELIAGYEYLRMIWSS